MAKKNKKAEKAATTTSTLPEGYKAYKKIGGGSLRFPNRIIKSNQLFAINPDAIPDAFKDTVKEVPYVEGIVIVKTDLPVKPSKDEIEKKAKDFTIKRAKDESGEFIKEGKNFLYNVVAKSDNSVVSEKPLEKGKAKELADLMNA